MVHVELDGLTLVIGAVAVVLALGLGAGAGSVVGVWAGVLSALAGFVPPAVLAVAVERRQRNAKRKKEKQEVLHRFAPPKPTTDGEGKDVAG